MYLVASTGLGHVCGASWGVGGPPDLGGSSTGRDLFNS
jgi:hypothetical protein